MSHLFSIKNLCIKYLKISKMTRFFGRPLRAAVLSSFKAVELVVSLRGGEVFQCRPRAAVFYVQSAEFDTNISHLTPVLSPRIPYNPVLPLGFIVTPAYNGDHVVNEASRIFGDTTEIYILKENVSTHIAHFQDAIYIFGKRVDGQILYLV